MANKTEWIGKKFGKLTAISKIGDKGNVRSYFLCNCECGIQKKVWGGSLAQGGSRSCGCLRNIPEQEKCIIMPYTSYERHAQQRDIEFKITKKEFFELSLKECFYCGVAWSNIANVKRKNGTTYSLCYNGIDRVDNLKGYEFKNCVPFFKLFNWMKIDLTLIYCINHIYLVIKKQQMALAATGV